MSNNRTSTESSSWVPMEIYLEDTQLLLTTGKFKSLLRNSPGVTLISTWLITYNPFDQTVTIHGMILLYKWYNMHR